MCDASHPTRGRLPRVRWPFDKRVEPTHAWGVVAVGTAGLISIPTALVALHANEPAFHWWWPTNWMIVPAVIFLGGIALLVVPVRRSAFPSSAITGPPQSAVEV